MLLLLPPSEGKSAPAPGAEPVALDALAHAPVLGRSRRRVLGAMPDGAKLRKAPAAPAFEVYSGVLYGRLGLADLGRAARRRAADDLMIFSGLWGVVGPEDRIPHYKLPIAAKLPRLGTGLASHWRPVVTAALAERDVDGEVVVDARSGGYVAVWKPQRAAHVAVRSFRVHADGSRQVISHNAKVARGDVVRACLRSRRVIRVPDDVAVAARGAGLQVELAGDDRGWTLDVLERA